MASKHSIPDRNVPFVDEKRCITLEWLIALQPLLKRAETQADAAGANPTKEEFDALIDKLQAAGVME